MTSLKQLTYQYTARPSSGTPIPALQLVGNKQRKTTYNAGAKRDQPQWVTLNEFQSTYFSGLDISIYAGNIYLDEVVQLQFSEMEQVRPLYGYSDYTFRHVAHGSRIVQGTFVMNFKDGGYMPTLLQKLNNPKEVESDVKGVARLEARYANQTHNTDLQYLNNEISLPTDRLALTKDLTLEDIVNMSTTPGGDLVYKEYAYPKVMRQLREKYWGGETTADEAKQAVKDENTNKAKYQMTQFDTSLGFDIVVKYGQPEDYDGGRPGWGTIEVIRDCHITGFSKSIDDSGRNILEVYQFLARTID